MASLKMGVDSYYFNQESINEEVKKISPGNYALGYIKENGKFCVRYVGRSDHDVAARLRSHLDDEEIDEYEVFKFSYATSPRNAYLRECENWHDFGEKKLINRNHPARPQNTDWLCPVCGKAYRE